MHVRVFVVVADNKFDDAGTARLSRWLFHRAADGLPPLFVRPDVRYRYPSPAVLREWDVPQEYGSQPLINALAYVAARGRSGGSTTVCRVKVVVIGDPGAGKSSLVDRLVHGTFDPHKVMTDGVFMGTFAFALSLFPTATHSHGDTQSVIRRLSSSAHPRACVPHW